MKTSASVAVTMAKATHATSRGWRRQWRNVKARTVRIASARRVRRRVDSTTVMNLIGARLRRLQYGSRATASGRGRRGTRLKGVKNAPGDTGETDAGLRDPAPYQTAEPSHTTEPGLKSRHPDVMQSSQAQRSLHTIIYQDSTIRGNPTRSNPALQPWRGHSTWCLSMTSACL
jgi:hypothetical protein